MFFDVYKALCAEKDMSPNGVAKEIGIASPSVTQWKHGSTPRPAVLQRIAEYFGVSVSYLLTGEEQKESPPQGGEPPTIEDWEKALEGKSKEELKEIMDIVMKKFMETN